jgi:hypothetical protein
MGKPAIGLKSTSACILQRTHLAVQNDTSDIWASSVGDWGNRQQMTAALRDTNEDYQPTQSAVMPNSILNKRSIGTLIRVLRRRSWCECTPTAQECTCSTEGTSNAAYIVTCIHKHRKA